MREFVPSQAYMDKVEAQQIKLAGKLIVAVNKANVNAVRAVCDRQEHIIADIRIICHDNPAAQVAYRAKWPAMKAAFEQKLRKVLYGFKDQAPA